MDVREKLVELLYNSPQLDVLGGLSYYEEAADHLIANGVTLANQVASSSKQVASSEWISVKDRLPDLELVDAKANDLDVYPCLCEVKNQNARGGRYVAKLFYDGENFVDRDRCIWTFETTHWMPLPQPPKGE